VSVEKLIAVRILKPTLPERLPPHLQGFNGGEVVGFPAEEASLLVSRGIAAYIHDETEPVQ
jgi:hypothetical protein